MAGKLNRKLKILATYLLEKPLSDTADRFNRLTSGSGVVPTGLGADGSDIYRVGVTDDLGP